MTTNDKQDEHSKELLGAHHVEDEPMPEGEEEAPSGVRRMSILRWTLVALMALAAAASIAHYFGAFERAGAKEGATQYYCPMHPSVVQSQPGECPICSMSLVPKEGGAKKSEPAAAAPSQGTQAERKNGEPEGAYYCPMHPEVTSNDPNAKCDKCGGMKLVPKPAKGSTASATGQPGMQEGSHAGNSVPGLSTVTLSPERIQLMGMRTATVMREKLIPELRTVGYVTASEEGLAQIHTRFAGWIERLLVTQTGQRVSKGQILATIYSPELLTAQQELLSAQKWSGGANAKPLEGDRLTQGLEQDSRRRLELLGISRSEIDEILRTGAPKRAIEIRSPVEGYVTRKNAINGLYVQPGMELFEVTDLSTLWVLVDIYEHDVERIRVGAKARLQLASFRGVAFTGRVKFIYPTVDVNTRTLRARLEFRNSGLKLRPGMYGDVQIDLPAAEGLMVPAEAIVDTGEVQYVFIALADGKFEPRRVKIGTESEDKVQVLEGVKEGDVVVTTANFLIDSESRLHAAISGQAAEGGKPAAPAPGQGPSCETDFDKQKFSDKYQQCRACEVQHRGMGTMEEDCKKAISRPWK